MGLSLVWLQFCLHSFIKEKKGALVAAFVRAASNFWSACPILDGCTSVLMLLCFWCWYLVPLGWIYTWSRNRGCSSLFFSLHCYYLGFFIFLFFIFGTRQGGWATGTTCTCENEPARYWTLGRGLRVGNSTVGFLFMGIIIIFIILLLLLPLLLLLSSKYLFWKSMLFASLTLLVLQLTSWRRLEVASLIYLERPGC